MKQKKYFQINWDISVAGHLIENESSLNTVIREVKEELNIDLDKNQIEFLYSLRRTGETAGNIFFDTYLVKLPSNFDLSLIKLQSNEVKNIKMVNIDYLKKVVTEEDITFAPRKYECKMLIDYFK